MIAETNRRTNLENNKDNERKSGKNPLLTYDLVTAVKKETFALMELHREN